MTPRLCFAIVDHSADEFFDDLVSGLRAFNPDADIVWYDSGSGERGPVGVERLNCSRPLEYAKVTLGFLDLLEWAASTSYDYVVSVETDMAWLTSGYSAYLRAAMADADYLAPRFVRHTPTTSRWRPYRSLRPELPELLAILEVEHTNAAFSPAQVFSSRYSRAVVEDRRYPALREFVLRNKEPGRSYSLQEVLLPTLVDVLGLRVGEYPPHMTAYNRYRPYHSGRSVVSAAATGSVHFVHPVRRLRDDPARSHANQLVAAMTRES